MTPKVSTVTVRYEDWPARERRFWQDEFLSACEYVTSERGAILADRTKMLNRVAFARWLHFLLRTRRYRPDEPLQAHFSAEALEAYVAELLSRMKPVSARLLVERLSATMRVACGREHAFWARDILVRLDRLVQRTRRPPRPLRSSAELFRLGMDLIARKNCISADRPFDAVRFRDGLMIALLAARPIRLANFARMRLGLHLLHNAGRYWLHFSSHETKSGVPVDLVLPRALEAPMTKYLTVIRPMFMRPNAQHDLAWASLRGTPMSDGVIYGMITDRTKGAFGTAISPHRFRHAAATSQARSDPANVTNSRHLLGHSAYIATEQHYLLTSTSDGAQALQRRLEELRRSQPATPRKRRTCI